MIQTIQDIYAKAKAAGKPVISFELFPPKTPEGERTFFEKSLPALVAYRPDYFSVTYGAGGGTRDKTLMIVEKVQRDHNITAMAHLTCVGSTREDIQMFINDARLRGIRNILALRGDPPGGVGEFQPTPGGFRYASEMVAFLRQDPTLGIAVAGFPEGHIACKEGKHADWEHLKQKVEAGASLVVTQLFFDNSDYFEFRDYVVGKLGVNVPLVPGIIPILSTTQIKKFTALCGAKLPAKLVQGLDALGDNEQAVTDFGIEYASWQCDALLKAGAPGIHFYTLNKSQPVAAILKNLDLSR